MLAYIYCSMEVEALQTGRAWQEGESSGRADGLESVMELEKTMREPRKVLSMEGLVLCGSPKLGRGLSDSPHFGSLETRLCARCGH